MWGNPTLNVRKLDKYEKQAEENFIMFDRITFDPKIMAGRACIRGMRITVSLILNLIANGMNEKEILTEYPDLEPEDIRQTLKYAAWLANEEVHLLASLP